MIVSLGAYLDELFKVSGRAPPTPRASTRATAPPSESSPAEAYVVHSKTHNATQLAAPFFAIPLPDGRLCVTDYGNHALRVLAADGTVLLSIGRQGRDAGELTAPLGIALSAAHELFVADEADRVQLLDCEGAAQRTFGLPTSECGASQVAHAPLAWLPHGGACCSAELPRPRVLQPGELNEPNPAMSAPRMASQSAPGRRLRQPYGVALGPAGRLYVSDRGHHRIACFASGGEFAFGFGERGSAPGELYDPRGLAVHARQVWVADTCNHRVSVFSLRGRPIRQIGRFGEGPAQFKHPVGVVLAADLLLVSEYTGGRVQVLTPLGVFLQVGAGPWALPMPSL